MERNLVLNSNSVHDLQREVPSYIEPISTSKRRIQSNDPTAVASRQRDQAYYEPEARSIIPRANAHKLMRDKESTASRNIIKDNMMKVIYDNSAAVKKAKALAVEKKAREPDMHRNYGKVPGYINRYHK